MALRPVRQERALLRCAVGDASRAAGDARPRGDGADDGVLALAGASLAVEDGLLMVFGPDGDPLPPATFAAAAATQPECPIRLGEGRTVPAHRVATVLDAQTRRPLAPAGQQSEPWILAMLGLGPQADDASGGDLAVEADACEITLFAKEILVGTTAGAQFLIAPAAPDGSPSESVMVLAEDDSAVPVPGLIARLRQSAGTADAAGEPSLPGFTFAQDDHTLLIATVAGERFRLADRAEPETGSGAAAILLPDGQAISVRELVAALDLAPEHAPAPAGDAGAQEGDPAPAHASADLGSEPADHGPSLALGAILEVDEPGPAVEGVPAAASCAAVTVPLAFGPPLAGEVAAPGFIVAYLGGVPPHAVLSAGSRAADGSWTLTPGEFQDLALCLPAWPAEPLTLCARAVAIEDRDGTMTVVRQELVVGAQDPITGQRPASPAAAERHIPLDLAGLLAAPGAEVPVTAVVIAGLPPAARLSRGTFEASIGRWVLRPDELDGLELVAPGDGPARVTLRVKLVGIDAASGQPRVVSRKLQVTCGGGLPAGERAGGVGFFRPLAARRTPGGSTERRSST